MKKQSMGGGALTASVLGLGCMRMGGLTEAEAVRLLESALACGIDLFDHADMYARGRAEEIFAHAFRALGVARDSVVLQSKCGIRDGYFDFSREHILAAVEGSLKRLETDYLDVLLLHRPDSLMEPEEVAAAFSELHRQGAVRHFGGQQSSSRPDRAAQDGGGATAYHAMLSGTGDKNLARFALLPVATNGGGISRSTYGSFVKSRRIFRASISLISR